MPDAQPWYTEGMGAAAVEVDVLVVGAGPAGSVAALTLARGGARVLLADKSVFPRDKACGDLVGPRGLRTLEELGLGEPPGPLLGDMEVIGPTGRRVRLPSFAGASYPRRAVAVTRTRLDAWLRSAALQAGAEAVTGRAGRPLWRDGALAGFEIGSTPVRAAAIIGADGAASHVASSAGLVDPAAALWAFAVRTYLPSAAAPSVELPTILWWEPEPRRPLRGYGWVFPGPDGRDNLGLGIGTLSDRRAAGEVMRRWPDFLRYLDRSGLADTSGLRVTGAAGGPRPPLGGWLKLGVVGTMPARGTVLLAGDAAGLVNPLQGEGIARALWSGRAAAEAVLAGPAGAAQRYRQAIAARHRRFEPVAVAAHRALVGRPRATAHLLRLVTAPGVGSALAGAWSLLWNDLVDGAPPGPARALARSLLELGLVASRGGATAQTFRRLQEPPGAGSAGEGLAGAFEVGEQLVHELGERVGGGPGTDPARGGERLGGVAAGDVGSGGDAG